MPLDSQGYVDYSQWMPPSEPASLADPHDLLWSVWTLEEASRELGLSIREVRVMLKSGELIGRRSGKTWLIVDPSREEA